MNPALARSTLPDAAAAPGWLTRLRGWAGSRGALRGNAGCVTALMMGSRPLAVRVEGPADARSPLRLRVGDEGAVRGWKRAGLFKGSQPLLVLRTAERQLLTVDQPQVPEAELGAAMRWPLAEAMDIDAEALLATAVALPRINDAQRTQVLAVGARTEPVRQHLTLLNEAGIAPRSIDIVDSALRGMALLARRSAGSDETGQASVVLASVGSDICIGLLWHGRFCALRTLALPAAAPRDASAFEEQLALHIQRTTDSFERQATQLAVRQVLALLPTIAADARDAVRAMLPLQARWFEPGEAFAMDAATTRRLADDDELAALACTAAARLLEPQLRPPPAAAAGDAAGDAA